MEQKFEKAIQDGWTFNLFVDKNGTQITLESPKNYKIVVVNADKDVALEEMSDKIKNFDFDQPLPDMTDLTDQQDPQASAVAE